MRVRPFVLPSLAVVFTLAAPVHFVVQTVVADEMSAASMTAALACIAFVLVTVLTGLPLRAELAGLGRAGAIKAAGAGLAGVSGAEYLVLANRYSDAPPGSEVIFFTTAVWGGLVLLAARVAERPSGKPTAAQFASGLLALAGAAAVLANWERPSSFSPFARYPREDLGLLLAGVSWAVFTVLVTQLGRAHRPRAFMPLATASAALAALITAALGPGRLELTSLRPEMWVQLFVAACALVAMLVSWSWLSAAAGPARTSALLFLPAVTLTLLAVFERRVGGAGPSPLLWAAVTSGSLAAVAGALGVGFLGEAVPESGRPTADGDAVPVTPSELRRRLRMAAVAVSGVAAVAATANLFVPALRASVRGTLASGNAFAASWHLPGAETPAAWIVLAGALLAVASALGVWRGTLRAPGAIVASGIGIVALLGVPALWMTPLRTWTRWLPGEVQHDYGTEYASLTFARASTAATWVVWAGVLVATVAVATVAISTTAALRRARENGEALSNDVSDGAE